VYMSTKQVAEDLGIRPPALLKAVWDGRLRPPPKTPAGDYAWRSIDVERAARVFGRRLRRRRKDVRGVSETGVA